MRPVLVTGATGFVGRHLVARLIASGEEVHALVRAASMPNARTLLPAKVHFQEYQGTAQSAGAIVTSVGPDAIFHLAAEYAYEHKPEQIDGLVDANLRFGLHLVDAVARHAPACCFVNVGTFWQYPNSSSYEPTSLYAALKQSFVDLLTYYAQNGLSAVTVLCCDTYGPGDRRKKIVDLLVESALEQTELMLSPGGQILNLLHVHDVVEGLIAARKAVRSGSPEHQYWIAPDEGVTLKRLAELVGAAVGRKPVAKWGAREYRPREVMRPFVGAKLPGWRPSISLEDGLREVTTLKSKSNSAQK